MRNDITFLRGISVLLVIFYHAELTGFEGGFVGVDIFFVISGFVITQAICMKIGVREFTILSFWKARLVRLYPALIFILTIVSVPSIYLEPNSMKVFGQSLVATVLSSNNLLLYMTSGYWAEATQFKQLFHTWSLGVEAHFYLFYPFVMLIFFKTRLIFTLLFLFIFISSFLAWSIDSDFERKFLLSPYRFWELMAGGISYLAYSYNGQKKRGSIEFWSVLLLVVVFMFEYAGVMLSQLVAVIITSVSLAKERRIRLKYIGTFSVWVGLASYSIYLWHQPLLAYLRYFSEYQPSNLTVVLVALSAIPIGALTYKYVETPFRKQSVWSIRMTASWLVVTISLLVYGLFSHFTFGLEKYRTVFVYGGDPKAYVDRVYHHQNEQLDDLHSQRILVIGNSFGRDFANVLMEANWNTGVKVAYLNMSCKEAITSNEHVLSKSDFIFLAQDFGRSVYSKEYIPILSECAKYISSKFKGKFFVIGGKNFGWSNGFIAFKQNAKFPIFIEPSSQVSEFNKAAKIVLNEQFIDLLSILSDESGRVPVTTPKGEIISFDTYHLTPAGAKYLSCKVLPRVNFLREHLDDCY